MWNYAKSDAFAWLLAPHTIEEFSEKYYERAPLLIRRLQPDYYASIFSLAELERVLFSVELTPAFLRVAKNGTDLRVEAYTRKSQITDRASRNTMQIDVIDPHRVSSLFAQGCTVVLENLQDCCAPVGKLTGKLEAFFGHEVFAGYFLTPPGSQGLPVHFDTMDTIVMQIEGRKRWRMYAPELELPLQLLQRSDKKKYDLGSPVLDVELEPGDMLYLPRGTFHEPTTGADAFSLHVTLGLIPLRWNAVLERALLNAALESVELRRSTHVPLDRHALMRALEAAFSAENLHHTLASMEASYAASHAHDLNGQLSQVLKADELTSESSVALRADALYDVKEKDGSVLLGIAGTELTLPGTALAILQALSEHERMHVSQLAELGNEVPGILRRLIRAGLVVQLGAAASPAEHAIA